MPTDAWPESDADVASAVFLVGLFGFCLSALGYLAALALAVDVRLPLATNAGSAAIVVAWVAADRLADPTSGVTTLPGAVGTAMLVLSGYGLVVAAVVAGTARWHGRFGLVWALLGGAAVVGILGAITFPLEAITGAVDRSEHD